MTPSFDDLFDQLGGARRATASPALEAILAMGATAIPELVKQIAGGRGRSEATAALSFLTVDDRVAAIEPLLHHADHAVRNAAVRALARTGDRRALPAIASDGDRNPELAIKALGDLGAAEGIATIRAIAEHEVGELARLGDVALLQAQAIESGEISSLFVVCAAAASLAKLGDFSLREAACALARFEDEGEPQAGLVRLDALHALDVMVGPGIASVLEQCCSDPDGEVAAAAAHAELHLGRIRAADHWLRIFERDDGTLATPAHTALYELTGRRPPEDAREARAWWAKRSTRYDPVVCYRFGIPASPARLIVDARRPDSAIARAELRQMLGLPFLESTLSPPPAAEIAALDAWWHDHAGEFPSGKLHRWGRTYEPDACD